MKSSIKTGTRRKQKHENRLVAALRPLLGGCFGFSYPMVRTDVSKVGASAGAEVERSHREAASVQTHHVGPTGSAILHIAQVGSILQQSMASSDGNIQALQNCTLY